MDLLFAILIGGTVSTRVSNVDVEPHLKNLYEGIAHNTGYLQFMYNKTRVLAEADHELLQIVDSNVWNLYAEVDDIKRAIQITQEIVSANLTNVQRALAEAREAEQASRVQLQQFMKDYKPLSKWDIIAYCVIFLTLMGAAVLGGMILLAYQANLGSSRSPLARRIIATVLHTLSRYIPMYTTDPSPVSEAVDPEEMPPSYSTVDLTTETTV